MNILRAYNQYVAKYPLITLALTSGTGMAIGNTLCQSIMYNKTKQFSWMSVAQYAAYGFVVSGPFMRYWWFALDLRIFKNSTSRLKPFKMMLLDQLITPVILNAIFLYYLAFANGESHAQCIERVKEKLLTIVVESYKIWPAATLINFYLIPLNHRVLFANVVAILWISYFTYMVSKKQVIS